MRPLDEPRACAHRLRIEIRGLVQGVGFRPYVYRLASEMGLAGWVSNDTTGVLIEVEGARDPLELFLRRLGENVPPLARIHSLESAWLAPAGYRVLEIRPSEGAGALTVPVLPDIASCEECLTEVFDPGSRRYGYPFTNCTNCGPRFSIIRSLPYDRPRTTMERFTMCPSCLAEYEDPRDRRFHAQPNACPDCGPALALVDPGRIPADPENEALAAVDPRGGMVARSKAVVAFGGAALAAAAAALGEGRIVAVKGLGGFHLMVDARDDGAVARLRERKPRREKPFALMVRDIEQARALCELTEEAARILSSAEAPILLLPRKIPSPVATSVAPGSPRLGLMLPATPLHHILLRQAGFPVVATSGNLSDEPISTDNDEALSRLGGIADLFLVNDRPIARHVDDSVGWIARGDLRLLRRARGYAPSPVPVRSSLPSILAVGGHLKGTVALSVDRRVFMSQHIGDLDSPESLAAFERVIDDFLGLYESSPVAIAHDLHPDYQSTRWALRAAGAGEGPNGPGAARGAAPSPGGIPDSAATDPRGGSTGRHHESAGMGLRRVVGPGRTPGEDTTALGEVSAPDGNPHGGRADRRGAASAAVNFDGRGSCRAPDLPGAVLRGVLLVPVQHHHAHLASCLAENGTEGPALGVTWDGTGYGTDGTVWGGEFLLGSAGGFQRAARLREFRLPGGEAAVREPRRCAAALLFETLGESWTEEESLTSVLAFAPEERAILGRMLARGFNSPVTTSAGRLFDAVSSLVGLRQVSTFEGQAAMELEWIADPHAEDAYPFPLDLGPSTLDSPGLDRAALILDWGPLVGAILEDVRAGVNARLISARFHNALARAIVAVAEAVGTPRVALTGGCFQNHRLLESAAAGLEARGFEVLLHHRVPSNDGGISLGQVAVAAELLATGWRGGPLPWQCSGTGMGLGIGIGPATGTGPGPVPATGPEARPAGPGASRGKS